MAHRAEEPHGLAVRLAAMLNTHRRARSTRRLLAGGLLVVFSLAACGSAAAPSPSAGVPGGTPEPTPTAVPGVGGGSGGTGVIDPGSGGGSGGSGGNTGGGIVFPIPPNPNLDPLLGDANYVKPAVGLIDQRTVNVQLVRAVVDDARRATADLRWWSGVAPCNQLDSVQIERDDAAKTIKLKVIEGSAPGEMACIDLAELRATAVILGELASGKWTVSAEGDAKAISLDVP